MGVTTSGLRWPEPTDPVAQGALAIRSLAEDVTTHAAKLLGSATMNGPTLPAGGGTLGLSGALAIAAAAYPRIIQVTLVTTLSLATTYCNVTIRSSGTAVITSRVVTPQHTHRMVWTELLPANTARSFDAIINSTAGASTYATAGLAELSAVGYLAA